MSIVALQFKDAENKEYIAILPLESQMSNPGYTSQIPHLLFGNHKLADLLVYKVPDPGSEFERRGVTSYIYVCFFEDPILVTKWIKSISTYVPAGWLTISSESYLRFDLGGMQIGDVFVIKVGLVKVK